MKKLSAFALVISLMASACAGVVDGSSFDAQPSPSGSSSATPAPDYACAANPAVEVKMQGAADMSTSIVHGGPVTSVMITAHCDIFVKHMRFRITGADTQQYIVGTKNTKYFTDWRVMNDVGETLMGPLEFSNALNAGSLDSGMMDFHDEFSMSKGTGTAYNLDAMFSQTEDAPGQFKHGDKIYFVWMNDGKSPFELGDVQYADGSDVPLDRIQAQSSGLYTYVNMPQNLP